MYQLQTSQTPALTAVPLKRQSTKSEPSTHRDLPAATQLTPIAQILLKTNPRNRSRRRGVVLTEQGWQKLLQAGVVYDSFGKRYTFAELSEWTLLDPRTTCRIVGREVGVDKRSLTIFFNAFNLKLEKDDYTVPATDRQDKSRRAKAQAEEPLSSSVLPNSEEELTSLKQQIVANCQRLAVLSGFNESSQITLTVKSPEDQSQLDMSLCQHYHLHLSLSSN